jgi:GTPase
MFMFIDELELVLKAGNGGPGKVAFFPGKKSGPCGGNGGKGADLYVRGSHQISNLNQFLGKKIIASPNGSHGDHNNKFGLNGEDLFVNLPVGTTLIDLNSGEEIELSKENQQILVCKGGKGGKGNAELKSSKNTAPHYAQPGLKGQKRDFKIIVKLIADFGLIGLPNAGKSSLLNELTNTDVKVAPYAFTTLEPSLGVMNGKVIADIPGLIEGASTGKGLGIKFLRHIEKVSLLLHCISAESTNLTKDFKVIIKELQDFSPELAKKKQIIILTKSDTVEKSELDTKVEELKKLKLKVIPVSILDTDSIENLKNELK